MAILQYIKDNLLTISTLITSGGIIAGFVYRLFKRLLKKELEPFIDMIKEQDKKREEQHKETMQQIAEIKKENDFNNIDVIRNRMSSVGMLCRLDLTNNTIEQDQYRNFFKDETKWRYYHTLYPELNGEMDEVIKYVHKHYENANFK